MNYDAIITAKHFMIKKGHFTSIRLKITALVLISTFVLAIAVILVSALIIQSGNLKIEESDVRDDLARVHKTIDGDFSYLGVSLVDWSNWDDTYLYVQGENPGYEETNLQDSTLVNLGLDALIIADNNDNLVYKKVVDLESGEQVTNEIISDIIINTHPVFKSKDGTDIVTGFILTPDGLLMVASAPILNNDASLPSRGTLVFAKFLGEEKLAEIEGLTDLAINIFPYNSDSLPSDVADASSILEAGELSVVMSLSPDLVAGYDYIYNLNGEPIGVIKIETNRTIYKQGQTSFITSLVITTSFILAIGLIINLLLGRFLVTRFTRLSKEVEEISQSQDITKRVAVDKVDEIGQLARLINDMLAALSAARATEIELQESEKRSADELKKQIEEVQETNKVMVGRELKMIELKKKIEDLEARLDRKGTGQ